jgi:formate hydrogenlyase subunit 3/multisubunit Na+/H+ antiporter MnhD subunit
VTAFSAGLLAQLVLFILAVAAAQLPDPRTRNRVTGVAIALLGLAGAVTGYAALSGGGPETPLVLATPLPGVDVSLSATPLGGLFTLLAGVVGALAAIFAIDYAHGPAASRTAWSALALFLLGLQLVPLAGDIVGFLLAWELMAVSSTTLVLTEHARSDRVRAAGLWYAVMTQLSFLLIAAGLGTLAQAAGSTSLAAVASAGVSGSHASVAFVLLTLGFAAKAGLMPLHVWLPRAHPEAPSHVSALMSAAMVKMGVYGVLLATTRLLPDGPAWWGLALLALALPSALYGILQASVASDLKRLLAYSTTENIGLILTAVALSQLAKAVGNPAVADSALVAALLLTLNHAAFKTLLFLGAGAIIHATSERDLDRLGGLASRMSVTTATLAIGALAAAALPLSSGFVAEWALLQSLIHTDTHTDRLVTALLPAMIAVVALTAGLALLTFTKVFGISALARPRSEGAAAAAEVPGTMRAALIAACLPIAVIGLVPGFAVKALAGALPSGAAGATSQGGLDLHTVGASLQTMSVLGLGALLTLPLVAAAWSMARKVPRVEVELGWGCGGVRTSPRMQYTATSYAEPLLRVFDDALSPTRDVEVTHVAESRHTVRTMSYSQTVTDVVEARLYEPGLRAVTWVGDRARGVQNGSIHRYLAFSFTALVLVLIGVLR